MVYQFKMLLNVDKCFRLQAAKVLFRFNISQEWSQVAGQTQIIEALLNTENKESNFSSGSEKRRIEGLKKMRDREERCVLREPGRKGEGESIEADSKKCGDMVLISSADILLLYREGSRVALWRGTSSLTGKL